MFITTACSSQALLVDTINIPTIRLARESKGGAMHNVQGCGMTGEARDGYKSNQIVV